MAGAGAEFGQAGGGAADGVGPLAQVLQVLAHPENVPVDLNRPVASPLNLRSLTSPTSPTNQFSHPSPGGGGIGHGHGVGGDHALGEGHVLFGRDRGAPYRATHAGPGIFDRDGILPAQILELDRFQGGPRLPVPVPAGPEGIAISPDGQWVAVQSMAGPS